MKGFSNRWKDFPDYILGITREIWEGRGIGMLNHYYDEDMVIRTPLGLARGNRGVMMSTMATLHEFPDRELLGEDVIWSGDDETGFLSSHRIISRATHSEDGMFGPATGKRFCIRVIADCAARADTIYDEWLVRDYGGLVRQLGFAPRDFAEMQLAQGAGAVFTPDIDADGGYHGRGNDNPWGQRYADTLRRIMDLDFAHIHTAYDRAVVGEYAGGRSALGWQEVTSAWLGLRSSFPNAAFKVHHQIGMEGNHMPPRAAVRWSLDGLHEGWGSFGAPTGKRVHVMGISHAEYGPYGPDGVGLRREFALFDEVAVWMQILKED